MTLQASWSQGNSRFSGNGQHFVANSAVSIRYSHIYSPSSWDRSSLDLILTQGDQLYQDIQNKTKQKYLSINDIPSSIGKVKESFHGTLHGETEIPFYKLEDSIFQASKGYDKCGCIFTMGITHPFYSSAIIKNSGKYYFVDPHSRNDVGMVTADGLATMTSHKNIPALSLFIRQLAASLNKKGTVPYEIACLTSDSEFSGFDVMSEGEYTCRLFISDNVEVSYVSDYSVSSVASIDSSMFGDELNELSQSQSYLQCIDINKFEDISDFVRNEKKSSLIILILKLALLTLLTVQIDVGKMGWTVAVGLVIVGVTVVGTLIGEDALAGNAILERVMVD